MGSAGILPAVLGVSPNTLPCVHGLGAGMHTKDSHLSDRL
jgi:hypothetical protein